MSVNKNRLREAHPKHALFKFAAVALAATLAACVASAPRWSAAQPSGSPLLGRPIGPALDCSDYDNVFTTPDAVKLPLSSCRGN